MADHEDQIMSADPLDSQYRRELRALSNDPWRHRSAGMLCGTCMWYVPKAAVGVPGTVQAIGRCRRHAPTMNGYPVVYPTDWCGDHKLDETKVQL